MKKLGGGGGGGGAAPPLSIPFEKCKNNFSFKMLKHVGMKVPKSVVNKEASMQQNS